MPSNKDRFVAFAFATCDVLFEVDPWGAILFAGGATQWLLGQADTEFGGQNLLDQVKGDQRNLLKAVMNQARTMGRAHATVVRFTAPNGRSRPATVYGAYLPEYPNSIFLTMQVVRPHLPLDELKGASRDSDTGLLDVDSFARIATELAETQPEACANLFLSLFELEGFQDVRRALSDDDEQEFVANIAAYLQALSVDGALAARVAAEKFGIIHEGSLSEESVRAGMAELPHGDEINVSAADIRVRPEHLHEEDLAKALAYTIKAFADSHENFTLQNLGGAYADLLSNTRLRLERFRTTVANREFDIVLQPIVDLDTTVIHHYEALSRIHELGPNASPYDFISFAEDVGVIGAFDLAVCEKAIARVEEALAKGQSLSIAVNLSGRSLQSDEFIESFFSLLSTRDDIRDLLMFELTESSYIKDLAWTNAVLRKIRKLGHAVCLDDFGAGASGFQYLRELDADYVKIDGTYIQEALDTDHGRAFLRSMTGLCSDLGIATVGECVETLEQVNFLKELGIRYAQGYLFGRPESKVSGNCAPFDMRRVK